ncbi:MAG: glycosyltransferase [Chloroflexota bacterium]|nr:glycosyltransferase [Chloroflexota bacterium]
MRLLVITARYPTPDRPAAGAFVARRLEGVVAVTVIAPERYDRPAWLRYLVLLWRAITARGHFSGVEGHFVLPSGPIALIAARLRGIPLVIYAHGGDVRDLAHANPLFGWLARLVLRGAAVAVTNSTAGAAHVRGLGVEAEIVPPGVDLSLFAPTPRPAQRRVLYLGGAASLKGYDVARALADTLLGPGLRVVGHDELPALLARHDVVLVPSHEEAFGLVAAEAIAAGRWVVARAVGGLPEVIEDGVNGTLVSDGDFEKALAAIPDYDPQQVAATAARFSIEAHRAAMDAIWSRLLGSDSGPHGR